MSITREQVKPGLLVRSTTERFVPGNPTEKYQAGSVYEIADGYIREANDPFIRIRRVGRDRTQNAYLRQLEMI